MNINQAKTNEHKRHSKELKNLVDANKNELERQKLNHEINKSHIKQAATLELNNLRSQNQLKTVEVNNKHDKVLNEMKNTLTDVKSRTQKEANRIRKMFSDKKILDQKLFEESYKTRKNINQMAMQDLDHEKTIELQKIQREADAARNVLKSDLVHKRASQKEEILNKISVDKDVYSKHQFSQDQKFRKALSTQQADNAKSLVDGERKQQDILKTRNEYFTEQKNQIETLGLKQQEAQQKIFEEKYQQTYKKHEQLLQKLGHNKEKILNKLRGEFKTDLLQEVKKEDDTFYKKTSYKPNVEMNENKDGYILTLNVPEIEANKFNLVAENRELRLSMQRDFNFTRNEDGTQSTIKRVESINEKIPVEHILNGKEMSKSYKDGVLKFEVGLA